MENIGRYRIDFFGTNIQSMFPAIMMMRRALGSKSRKSAHRDDQSKKKEIIDVSQIEMSLPPLM